MFTVNQLLESCASIQMPDRKINNKAFQPGRHYHDATADFFQANLEALSIEINSKLTTIGPFRFTLTLDGEGVAIITII